MPADAVRVLAAAADSGGGLDLSGLAPAGGALVAMVTLVGYMLRTMAADRAEYRARREELLAAVAAAEARTEAERARLTDAQAAIDHERARRREAEDNAAAASSELEARDVLVRWYASEHRRLSGYLPPAVGNVLPDAPRQAAPSGPPPRRREP